jgi:hypothetical protein
VLWSAVLNPVIPPEAVLRDRGPTRRSGAGRLRGAARRIAAKGTDSASCPVSPHRARPACRSRRSRGRNPVIKPMMRRGPATGRAAITARAATRSRSTTAMRLGSAATTSCHDAPSATATAQSAPIARSHSGPRTPAVDTSLRAERAGFPAPAPDLGPGDQGRTLLAFRHPGRRPRCSTARPRGPAGGAMTIGAASKTHLPVHA